VQGLTLCCTLLLVQSLYVCLSSCVRAGPKLCLELYHGRLLLLATDMS
jgi:hypothetical protein